MAVTKLPEMCDYGTERLRNGGSAIENSRGNRKVVEQYLQLIIVEYCNLRFDNSPLHSAAINNALLVFWTLIPNIKLLLCYLHNVQVERRRVYLIN